MTFLRLSLVTLVLSSSVARAADEPAEEASNLDQLIAPGAVETASQRSQSLFETGPGVTVLTATEIQRLGITNVAEVLRYVPGAYVGQFNANYWNIGLRGNAEQRNNRVLVLLDGRNVADLSLGFPRFEYLPIHPDDIERVEILRGPATTRFGANAVSGVINIVSKRPVDHRGVEATAMAVTNYLPAENSDDIEGDIDQHPHLGTGGNGYAAYGWVNASGTFGARVNAGTTHNPEFTLTDAALPRARHGFFNYFVNGSVQYAPDDKLDVFANVSNSQNESVLTANSVAAGTAAWSSESAFTANMRWRDGLVEGLTINAQADGRTIEQLFPVLASSAFTIPPNGPEQQALHGLVIADYAFFDGRNTLTLGVEGSTQNGSKFYGTKIHARYAGLIVEDELRLLTDRSLIFTVGGRLERATTSAESEADDDDTRVKNSYGNFNPRASVVYRPSRDHALRLSAATAYRTPTPFENYVTLDTSPFPAPTPPLTFFAGKPRLRAERGRSAEVGYRGIVGGRLLVDATVYLQDLRDFVSTSRLQSLPLYFTNQGGSIRQVGTELSLEYNITTNVRAMVNYTFTHTGGRTTEGNQTFEGERAFLNGWPSHIFTLLGETRFAENWRFTGMLYGMVDSTSRSTEEAGYRGEQTNADQLWLEAFLARQVFAGAGEVFISARNALAMVRNTSELRYIPVEVYDPIGAQFIVGIRIAEVGL